MIRCRGEVKNDKHSGGEEGEERTKRKQLIYPSLTGFDQRVKSFAN